VLEPNRWPLLISRYNLGEFKVRGDGRGIQMLLYLEIWGMIACVGIEAAQFFQVSY
jgi:hypothetical protein